MKPEGMPSVALVHLADALQKGPPPTGILRCPFSPTETLEVELYTPIEYDPQQPHERDEIYVVARGQGCFRRN